MTKRPFKQMATALALGITGLLAAAPVAKASFFEFTTSVVISPIGSTPPGSPIVAGNSGAVGIQPFEQNLPTSTFTTPSNNAITLIATRSNPAVPRTNALGTGSNIVFGQIDARTNVPSPSEFVGFNYTFTLTVSDYSSATDATVDGIGTIQFTGRIQGTIGNFQVDLANMNFATNPANGFFTTSNGQLYQASINGFTAPGPDNNGSFGANIRAVPEPGSVALLGMGLVGAFGIYRRRRAQTA